MSDMTDVLRAHRYRGGSEPRACRCGHVLAEYVEGNLADAVAAHQAAALSAAGYGLVAAAKRGALEEAADMVDEGIGAHGQEEYVDWLRARAAEMRQG